MRVPMRRYPFPNIANFRDLGGLPAENGGMTRWGVFFRCADPHGAAKQEMDFVYEQLHVRTVIDLRADAEIALCPDPFKDDARFSWIHHSLIGPVSFNEDIGIDHTTPDTPTMVRFYKVLIERCEREFRMLMTYLAEGTARGAVMYHCSAGKDRTGIISMLLESLCGVPEKDIVSQYEISGTLVKDTRKDDITGSHHSNMVHLLEYIRHTFGSPKGYLLHAGVAAETLDTLRQALYMPPETD
jgi:protein-tyrosine phosphatase